MDRWSGLCHDSPLDALSLTLRIFTKASKSSSMGAPSLGSGRRWYLVEESYTGLTKGTLICTPIRRYVGCDTCANTEPGPTAVHTAPRLPPCAIDYPQEH